MTAPGTLSRMLTRGLRLVAQALGVVLLLFLILESGVAGDPAERALGDRPSLRRLGEFRVELGEYERFQASALEVSLVGAPGRVSLVPRDGGLDVVGIDGDVLTRWQAGTLTLAEVPTAWNALELPEQRRLQVRLLDESLAALPAVGLTQALRGTRLIVDSRRPVQAPWAQARPGWKRFLHQTGELLRFDFGRGLDGQAIGPTLRERGLRSLTLALPAWLLGTACALGLALFASRRPGSRWDRHLGGLSAAVIAISGVSWVLLLRGWFAADLAWFPVTAWDPPSLHALALPILIWAFLATWPDFQIFRSVLREAATEPHVQAARARGLADTTVWRRHVLQSASAALVAYAVLALPFLVLGSLILEQVFVVPGLGSYLVDAARTADAAVLRAVTFLLALLYLLAQLLGDWITGRLDPRFRREAAR